MARLGLGVVGHEGQPIETPARPVLMP